MEGIKGEENGGDRERRTDGGEMVVGMSKALIGERRRRGGGRENLR